MEFHLQRKPRRLQRKPQDNETSPSPEPSGKIHRILSLQRTIGNKATQSMLQREAGTVEEGESVQQTLSEAADLANHGNPVTAIRLFEDLLENSTLTAVQKAKVYYNLGVCYLKTDDSASALTYFGKSIAMGPVDDKVYKAALRGHQKARKYLNEDYDPQDVYDEGVALFGERDYQNAIEKFSIVLNMFNSLEDTLKAKALYNLGACYYRLSKYRQALNKFEEALAVGSIPADVLHYIQRGIRKAQRRIGMRRVKSHKKPTIF